MLNTFFPAVLGARMDFLPKKQESTKRKPPQKPIWVPAHLSHWSAVKSLYLQGLQRFGASNFTQASTEEEPVPPGTFQKLFFVHQEPSLVTPKAQILKLSESLKEALTDTSQPMPEQIRLRLVYEQVPPIRGIRQFLENMANQAQGNSPRMLGARLFMGMPRYLPAMELLQSPRNEREIIFLVKTENLSRQELLQFANFLVKGSPFLPEKYE